MDLFRDTPLVEKHQYKHYKLKSRTQHVSFCNYHLITSSFAIRVDNQMSPIFKIHVCVIQEPSPPLFYSTSNQLTSPNTFVADYVDDKIFIAINNYHKTASSRLQLNFNDIITGSKNGA